MENTLENATHKLRGWRQMVSFLVAMVLCFTLLSESVSADSTGNVQCTASGVNTSSQFFNPALVYKDYRPKDTSANPPRADDYVGCGTINTKKFFSGIACNFLVTMNAVFGKFYCAVQFGMKEILVAIMAVFVVVFGAKLLMGLQEATLGATIAALIKLGVVVSIVGSSYWGMGLIYDFFVNIMMDTISWIVKAVHCELINPMCFYNTNFTTTFEIIDSKIYNSLMGVPAPLPPGAPPGTPTPLINGLFSANAELVALYLSLAVICLPLSGLVTGAIFTTIKFFVSTVVSTLLCLIIVSFLIALTPIFISFMLFGSTYSVFDSWLKNLIAYTIQPMLVFAIFFLWVIVAVDFTGFVGQISKVMMYKEVNNDKGAVINVRSGEEGIRFCRLRYLDSQSRLELPDMSTFFLPRIALGGPSITCCQTVPNLDKYRPSVDVNYQSSSCDPDATKNYETVEEALLTATPINAAESEDIKKRRNDFLRPSQLLQENRFIYFIAYHIISLLVVSYAFMSMLNMAPQLAQQMAQSKGAAPLGAGFGGGSSSLMSMTNTLSSRVFGKGDKDRNMGKTPSGPSQTTPDPQDPDNSKTGAMVRRRR